MSEVNFKGLNEVRFQDDALLMVRLGNDQVWPTPPTGYRMLSPPLPGNGWEGNGRLDFPTSATITRGSKKFQIIRTTFNIILHGYDSPTPTLTFPLGFATLQIGDIIDATFYHEFAPFAPPVTVKFILT